MAKEIAMLHDLSTCTACRGCMVACKQWKDLPADKLPFKGDFQSHPDLTPHTLILIKMKEDYSNGKLNWNFVKFQCMHCGNPGCVKACPTGALSKKSNGVISFNEEICVGCGYCEVGCPYSVPKIDKVKHKSTKCNLCEDRIEAGMEPACSKTCTARAIFFGTREEMIELANKRLSEIKEQYPNAQLYNVSRDNSVQGGSMMYILPDNPKVYELPENPEVSPALTVWKDWIQPGGKTMIGIAAGAVVGATILNSINNKESK